MSSANLTAAKDEILAAHAAISKFIEGHRDLAVASLSGETVNFVNETIDLRVRRSGLLKKTLAALVALDEDGFPDMPPTIVSEHVLDELKAELEAIAAAVGDYAAQPVASELRVSLGDPEDKTTTKRGK